MAYPVTGGSLPKKPSPSSLLGQKKEKKNLNWFWACYGQQPLFSVSFL